MRVRVKVRVRVRISTGAISSCWRALSCGHTCSDTRASW